MNGAADSRGRSQRLAAAAKPQRWRRLVEVASTDSSFRCLQSWHAAAVRYRGPGRSLRDFRRRNASHSNHQVGSWPDSSRPRHRTVSPQPVEFTIGKGAVMSESEIRAELFSALRSLSEVAGE